MNSYEVNSYPDMVRNGVITKREAVDCICRFIVSNYKVFNLQRYDEDFRSELIISFLEKSDRFMDSYDPTQGDFFTYLYCYINSLISAKVRVVVNKKIQDNVVLNEGINTLREKLYKYTTLNHKINEVPKYSTTNTKLTSEEIKKIFSTTKSETIDKRILVLALKSSAYITDDQIKKVCRMYNLNVDEFYKTIEFFNEELTSKQEKKLKVQERRNYNYYHHKKYVLELEKLSSTDHADLEPLLKQRIIRKKNVHELNWKKLNERLENGYIYLRPTTKSISNVLGICERQVNYLLNCAKKEALEDDIQNIENE